MSQDEGNHYVKEYSGKRSCIDGRKDSSHGQNVSCISGDEMSPIENPSIAAFRMTPHHGDHYLEKHEPDTRDAQKRMQRRLFVMVATTNNNKKRI